MPPPDDARSRALDDLSIEALRALDAVFLAFRLLLGHGDSNTIATETAARLDESTADLFQHAQRTASQLIRRNIFAELDASLEIENDRRDLKAAIAELDAACEAVTVIHGTPTIDEFLKRIVIAGREDTESFLEEVGCEEADAEIGLVFDDADAPVIWWRFLPREMTTLGILPAVFSSAEYIGLANEITGAEIAAATLWFSRWMVKPEDERDRLAAFVRAKEWVVGGHRSIMLQTTLVDELLKSPHVERLPAKQRAMAEALARSRGTLYRVAARDGTRATLEDLSDGSVVVMREHVEGADYEVGDIAVGRVYDLGGAMVLRSPGMFFFSLAPGGYGYAEDTLGPAFRMLVEDRGDTAAAAETALRVGIAEEEPESVRDEIIDPEESNAVARVRLPILKELLRKAGLMEKLDEPMTDFLAALERQSKEA